MTAVVGLGFGDEGKGLATSYLCAEAIARGERPVVVRFNGGHQAGHTVVHGGRRHVFSHFGSGSLQGCPTYWSEYCTFHPTTFINEIAALGGLLRFYAHPLCPITTPYDILLNQKFERTLGHGSVGVGFGSTLQREQDHHHLFLRDLRHHKILTKKLELMEPYYAVGKVDIQAFVEECEAAVKIAQLQEEPPQRDVFTYPIYEGAQGIMLDQRFGFFPHVTRSNTTSENAMKMGASRTLFVTRSYQTRHGNGPMTNEGIPISLVHHENETNRLHEFQGRFRTAPLDIDLLNYALECDPSFDRDLMITCMDQHDIDVSGLLAALKSKFGRVLLSYGPSASDVITYKP